MDGFSKSKQAMPISLETLPLRRRYIDLAARTEGPFSYRPSGTWSRRHGGGRVLVCRQRPSPPEKERTFTIITTTPNALLEPVHNRMPVVLEEEAVDDWLYARQTAGSLMELLRPVREDYLVGTPVSARVNSVKNDDPECPTATVGR